MLLSFPLCTKQPHTELPIANASSAKVEKSCPRDRASWRGGTLSTAVDAMLISKDARPLKSLRSMHTAAWSLTQEDPRCLGATKPMRHNYWARVQQLLKYTHPRARAPQQEKPQQWEAPTCRNYRKSAPSNEDPAQPKIKFVCCLERMY